jgi:hypothetical protein
MEDINKKNFWIVSLLVFMLLMNSCSLTIPKPTANPTVNTYPAITNHLTLTSTPTPVETPTTSATNTSTTTSTNTITITPTITNTPSPTPFGGTGKLTVGDRGEKQYLFDFGSMQAEEIYEGYGLISFSPDGSMVALESNPKQHHYFDIYNDYSLYIAKYGEEDEPVLVSSSFWGFQINWSADSKSISFYESFPDKKIIVGKIYMIDTQQLVETDDVFFEYPWHYKKVSGTQLEEISGPYGKIDLSTLPVSIPEVLPWPGKITGTYVHYVRLPDKQRFLVFLTFYNTSIENPGTPNERSINNAEWQNGAFYVVSNKGELLLEFSLNELFPPWKPFIFNDYVLDSYYPISPDGQWFVAGKVENHHVVFWLVNLTTGEIQKITTEAIMNNKYGSKVYIDWLPK